MVKLIVLIPARKGSKRVPNKNMYKLNGIPLIGYSIEEAKKVKNIDHIYVTSDSDEILAYAEKLNVQTIKRPIELSTDNSRTADVIKHAIKEKNILNEDILILLQPTSPLRKSKHILEAIELFLNGEGSSVISVTKSEAYWNFILDDKNHLKPLFDWKYFQMRSQDIRSTYSVNGVIFITSVKEFIKNNSFYNDAIMPYFMDAKDSLDIDTLDELHLAEFRIKYEENKN